MMLGVIACAAAIEDATLHPDEPLSMAARIALAVGLVLFVGGMAATVWRASSRSLIVRLLLVLLSAAIVPAVGGYTGQRSPRASEIQSFRRFSNPFFEETNL